MSLNRQKIPSKAEGNRVVWRYRCGFSLIELLTVVGIVVILFMLAMQGFYYAKERANSVQCQALLREMSYAMMAFVGDHDGRLPGSLRSRDSHNFHNLKPVYWEENRPRLRCPRGNNLIMHMNIARWAGFGDFRRQGLGQEEEFIQQRLPMGLPNTDEAILVGARLSDASLPARSLLLIERDTRDDRAYSRTHLNNTMVRHSQNDGNWGGHHLGGLNVMTADWAMHYLHTDGQPDFQRHSYNASTRPNGFLMHHSATQRRQL